MLCCIRAQESKEDKKSCEERTNSESLAQKEISFGKRKFYKLHSVN